MKTALLAALLLAACATVAHADALVVTCCAWHQNPDHNNHNPGLGYEHPINDNVTLGAGFYKNSFWRHTTYALVSYQPYRVLGAKVGFAGGWATGYSNNPKRGMPALVPVVSFEGKRVGANIMVIPWPGRAEAAIQFKLKF